MDGEAKDGEAKDGEATDGKVAEDPLAEFAAEAGKLRRESRAQRVKEADAAEAEAAGGDEDSRKRSLRDAPPLDAGRREARGEAREEERREGHGDGRREERRGGGGEEAEPRPPE